MNIPLYVAVMAALVLMSAYFSATETAFSSLSKTKLKLLSEQNKKAALAYSLSERYDDLLSTILIGNNIVNIALASMGTLLFVHLCGDIGATLSTVVITVIVLIFGEVCPKGIAKDHPESFAIFSVPIINGLTVLFTPFNWFFKNLKKLVSRLFRVKDENRLSPEELLLMVEEVQQEGGIDQEESKLLHNAIEFSDLKAADILTHRMELEAVRLDDSKEEVARVFSESKFSRLLVYEESIDKIVGVIHQKDFYTGTGVTDQPLAQIMTAPIFIPGTERIDHLLRLLQQKKAHIAVVLDEYGGTCGIVTMEDILEELVGEIWDEHDEVTKELEMISDTAFRVSAAMDLDEFCQKFSISPESDASSLGGWMIELMGKIPSPGECIDYAHLQLVIRTVENRRINLIDVNLKEPLPAAQSMEA